MAREWERVPDHPYATMQVPTGKSSKGSTKTAKTYKTTSKNSSRSTESLTKQRDRSAEAKKPLPTRFSYNHTSPIPEAKYSISPEYFAGQLAYSGHKKASIGSTPFETTKYLGAKSTEYESVGEGDYARRRRRLCSLMGILFILGNGFFVALPFLFLVLVGLAWRLDGQAVEDNEFGRHVYDAVQLAITIFPFAFAAVAGRTMKGGARFALERAARLGTVETLLGSQTLWQTLKTQVNLQRLSLFTLPLLALWSLSPIGSQGHLRMLTIVYTNTTIGSGSALVLPTGGMSESQVNSSTFFPGSSLDQRNTFLAVDSLYASTLLNPRKDTPRDPWGNVRVPWVDLTAGGDDWVAANTTINATDIDSFTSLTGIPVANVPTSGVANFTFDSSHFVLSCPGLPFNASYDGSFFRDSLGQIWGGSRNNVDVLFFNSSTGAQSNLFLDTPQAFPATLGYAYRNGTDLGGLDPTGAPKVARNIVFGSRVPNPGSTAITIAIRNCTVQLEYVESLVGCVSGDCRVEKVRKSPRYTNFNTFATPLDSQQISLGIMKGLPFATGAATYSGETPSGLFLRGSNTPIVIPRLGYDPSANMNLPDALDLDNNTFSRRLSILLNTYYQISLAPAAYLGDLPTLDSKLYGACTSPGEPCSSPDSAAPFFAISEPLNNLAETQAYSVDTLWLGLTATAAAVLCLVGILSIVLRNRTHAPDMLGYASTLIMDSGNVNVPPGTAPLDGADRARWLSDTTVRLVDGRVANVCPPRHGSVVNESVNGRHEMVEYS